MVTTRYVAIIPAAGVGSRFNSAIPKQYVKIGEFTILERAVMPFLQITDIHKVLIVVQKDDKYIDNINKILNNPKVEIAQVGGETRADTVLSGINYLKDTLNDTDWILVHDAARCYITRDMITNQIHQLKDDAVGGILAIPVTDTVKEVNNLIITKTLNRNNTYLAQTPQMFRYGVLYKALSICNTANITDEASAVEKLNLPVKIILGDVKNIKITDVHSFSSKSELC